jgi:predicted ribosomally synthesized peptide with SipW-like signal peptide
MSKKYELSRRKALAALGTIGVAGAGAGMGTSALFSDTESFDGNTLTAGELDLVVDYWTSVDSSNASAAIEDGQVNSDTIQGDVSGEYVLKDVKPGDGGFLVFCPKIIDNPAYLWAGSSGLTDFENGLTEPEGDVESTGGDPGGGNGELSENIQVTVSYCEYHEPEEYAGPYDNPRKDPENYKGEELDNPEDYTLADLILELQTGFQISNSTDGTYPASSSNTDQQGPCLCIDWQIPRDVGNVIQSDSVEFDIQFAAEQSRNNPNPQTPFGAVVNSNQELKTALNNGEPVTFAQRYSDSISEVPRTRTFSPSGNPDTFDVFDIDTSGAGLSLGSEGDLRQYGYIGQNGQLNVATGAVNPDTDILRIFVNQGVDDNPLYIVVTDQPNDDDTITPLGSDPVYVAKVDASVS